MSGGTNAGDGSGLVSGFVSVVGRPNVGKSTLVNRILGTKVSIVSNKPQTTRTQVRGVLHRPGVQIVFVDTPGVHRPRGPLGERLNAAAMEATSDVDVVCLVVDATARLGPGDRFVARECPPDTVVVLNKVDLSSPAQVAEQLARVADQLDVGECFCVSAATGEGVDDLVAHLVSRMPPGPPYYPDDMVTDVPEAFWVAELVREQLLGVLRDELPHAIATRVTEWEWPRVRCEILVQRDSQKGIVIGRGGSVLKQVGTAVRHAVDDDMFLELHVVVDPDWQRRPRALERLGY
jgi:GTP-binding protein Era